MSEKVDYQEIVSDKEKTDTTQKIQTGNVEKIRSVLANLQEIDQQKREYITSKQHKINDPELRAINTIKKLDKLPISEAPRKDITFVEGM